VKEVDYYGSRILDYIILGIIGLVLLVIGIIFLPSSNPNNFIVSIFCLFYGGALALAGWMGYRDEIQKFGIIRKHTICGYFACIFAISSLFAGPILFGPIVLGSTAMIFGYKAHKQGDLSFGEVGLYGGLIGILLGLFVIFLLKITGEL
jgi:hypothetical protein